MLLCVCVCVCMGLPTLMLFQRTIVIYRICFSAQQHWQESVSSPVFPLQHGHSSLWVMNECFRACFYVHHHIHLCLANSAKSSTLPKNWDQDYLHCQSASLMYETLVLKTNRVLESKLKASWKWRSEWDLVFQQAQSFVRSQQAAHRFAMISRLNNLFIWHSVQWCATALRCNFSCLMGVSEVLPSQMWPVYKPRCIEKTCTQWIQRIFATLASHSSAPLLPVRLTCCYVLSSLNAAQALARNMLQIYSNQQGWSALCKLTLMMTASSLLLWTSHLHLHLRPPYKSNRNETFLESGCSYSICLN